MRSKVPTGYRKKKVVLLSVKVQLSMRCILFSSPFVLSGEPTVELTGKNSLVRS